MGFGGEVDGFEGEGGGFGGEGFRGSASVTPRATSVVLIISTAMPSLFILSSFLVLAKRITWVRSTQRSP